MSHNTASYVRHGNASAAHQPEITNVPDMVICHFLHVSAACRVCYKAQDLDLSGNLLLDCMQVINWDGRLDAVIQRFLLPQEVELEFGAGLIRFASMPGLAF